MTGYDAQLAATPLPTWKTYLRFHVADAFANALPKRFADASFNFHSTVLNGVKEQLPRWQRCTRAADSALRTPLGKVYVGREFTPAAKARAVALVDNLQSVLKGDIGTLVVDEPADQGARGREARRVHQEDRLPRPLAGLLVADDRRRPALRARWCARCATGTPGSTWRASASPPTAACGA